MGAPILMWVVESSSTDTESIAFTAGGSTPTTTSTNNGSTTTPTTMTPGFGNDGTNGLTPGNPGLTPTIPDSTDSSRALPGHAIPTLLAMLSFLFVITH
ncbi:hypothetical protein TIFTF001_032984 [Ficus carica]|uniref:Uncharacterized protein n=1 Tax=Ficus carica TaxID=3494 RepID=A0AA88DZM2_FICCA|nr:hypothetical protein TIFTF001_032984 [Ficus carica]